MASPQQYRCQRNDRLINLTQEIANSGEAKVWRTNLKGYLAKIYHDPHNGRIQKLQLMVMDAPNDPNAHLKHISFAWPYSILEDRTGKIVGFLMPEVLGSETLLKICSPQLRRQNKLQINWYFLHVVARNVAGIIQAIHAKGYVLGDIKLENILVNNRALPTIIDTDSFQVPDRYSNKVHRCLVGSEGFTPAELMGVDIASVDQTEVHDRFRLGVVIYYLLFGGPPFRGIWQGPGDPPQQSELIEHGLWPFSGNSLITSSPTTIPLDILHPQLQTCFLQCFNDGHRVPHKRPTAADWVRVLELSLKELVSCGKIDSHFYTSTHSHCYWCERAEDSGVDIFPGQKVLKPKSVTPPAKKKPQTKQPTKKKNLWDKMKSELRAFPCQKVLKTKSVTPPVKKKPQTKQRTKKKNLWDKIKSEMKVFPFLSQLKPPPASAIDFDKLISLVVFDIPRIVFLKYVFTLHDPNLLGIFLLTWLITGYSFILVVARSIVIDISNFNKACIFAIAIGLLNALFRVALSFLPFSISLLDFVIFSVIINLTIFVLADKFLNVFTLNWEYRNALIVAFLLSFINALFDNFAI